MKRALVISFAVTLGLVAVLVIARQSGGWPAPEPVPYQGEAADLKTGLHSAEALARLIREPQNTWSNLAFIVGGALLVSTRRTQLARLIGVPLIAVGVGSFLYHASASAQWREVDVGAMYWLLATAVALCATVIAPRLRAKFDAHATTLGAATLALAVVFTCARNAALFGVKPFSLTVATGLGAAVVLLTLADTLRRTENIAAALQFLGIVTVFGLAAYFQVSDRPGRALYRPGAMIQGHAIWHVLSAVTLVWAITLLDQLVPSGPRGGEKSPRKG